MEACQDRILFELGLMENVKEEGLGERPLRAVGMAVKAAVAFCEMFGECTVRVCVLLGGPGTCGEGKVIGTSMS